MPAKTASHHHPSHDIDKKPMPEAHSLEEAANSDNSLEGYVAINHSPGPHGESEPGEWDEIAQLAYQFYLDRNGGPGSADEDWLRAEREVRNRGKKATIPGDSMNL